MRLAVMHNLYFYNKLTERIRDSLDNGCFDAFREEYSKNWRRRYKPLAKSKRTMYNSITLLLKE